MQATFLKHKAVKFVRLTNSGKRKVKKCKVAKGYYNKERVLARIV